ncbi:MAG: transposase [Rickettsiales bacterium]|nr:transposase [Rickettsiales bacterium]
MLSAAVILANAAVNGDTRCKYSRRHRYSCRGRIRLSHFEDATHLSSWGGLSPGNNEAEGMRRRGWTTKGNVHLSRIMCECTNAAIKTD